MSDKEPIISVIVPVYNTSRYLENCITSVCAQTLDNIEIILVDDGSTDGSDAICDKYATLDSRIEVIHKPNGGSASARQAGLNIAKGKYVIICDSDDWIDNSAYEQAYHKATNENSDIVFFGYVAEYEDGASVICNKRFSDLSDIELTRNQIMQSSWFHSWNKLIRRSLFTDNSINYEPGINMGEDALILHKLLNIRPLKISNLEEALYHYRISTGGYTTRINSSSIEQLLRVHEWVKTHINQSYHKEMILKSASDLCFESLRCEKFDSKIYNNIASTIPARYLIASPRSPQKLTTLCGKLFGWKVGRIAYKHLLPLLLKLS